MVRSNELSGRGFASIAINLVLLVGVFGGVAAAVTPVFA